jgi:predicted phosphodiesterase
MQFPLRIISDLHLGHDICTVQESHTLEPLLSEVQTLILNGDTLESRLPRFTQRSHELYQGFSQAAEDRGVQLVQLNGNHDPATWPHDALELFDGRLVVHHGHAFFRHVSPWSSKLKYCGQQLEAIWQEYSSEALSKVETRYELARRCSQTMLATDVHQKGLGLTAKLGMALRELWPPKRPYTVAKVWLTLPNIAGGFLDQFYPKAQAFCFGHTHRGAHWLRKGRLLVNTGAYVSFAQPLCVDVTSQGLLTVRQVVKDKANGTLAPGRTLRTKQLSFA